MCYIYCIMTKSAKVTGYHINNCCGIYFKFDSISLFYQNPQHNKSSGALKKVAISEETTICNSKGWIKVTYIYLEQINNYLQKESLALEDHFGLWRADQ